MSELDNAPVNPAPSELTPQTPPAPATQEPTPQLGATTQATSPAAATSQPQVEPSWLKGRLEETRAAALRQAQTQWSQQEAQYKAQLEQVQRQLHAIVGVAPQEDPNVSAVRQQFNQLFPGLAKLEERAQDLLTLAERSGDQDAQINHYWGEHARNRVDRLYGMASQAMGGQLTDEGKRLLHTAFTGYVSSSPELANRYMSDPSVVDEFWNYFGSSFIEPVRRASAATVQTQVQNRALPQDSPSGAPQVSPAPKPANLDERAATAWAQLQSQRRQ